jgi:ubiquinone/menaquinone biosynthesis C-methylase UbiE
MTTMWLSERSLEREYMDDHTPPQAVVDEIYRVLGAINRRLGGTRATLRRFDAISRGWRPGERISVVEVACGGGDIARALVAWGRAHGFDLRVTALDISASALDTARRRGSADPRLRFVCADVHRAPFLDGSVDYVTSTLFFHHLRDDEVVQTLRSFDRLARRGVVVNDLIRRRRAFLWSWLITRPFNAILRRDGPLSVRRAFRPGELATLAQRADVPWLSIHTHFGHRMTLAGERPPPSGPPTRRTP